MRMEKRKPRKSRSSLRTATLMVRLTTAELAEFQRRAISMGLSTSSWARVMLHRGTLDNAVRRDA